MKLKHLFGPLIGLAVISLPNPSIATDYKIYPGAGCQPAFGGQAGSFEMLGTYIKNTSTEARVVTCPLVREYIPATEQLDPGMRVASYNGASLICYFMSYDQKGVLLDYVSQHTTSSDPFPLVFSGIKTISNSCAPGAISSNAAYLLMAW